MFQYDTHQGRTDLYGIGKGAAQVLDLSHLFSQQEAEKERDFRREQAKTKAGDDRMDEINKMVVPIKGVLPKERDEFVKRTNELSQYAIKNAKALRDGDPNAVWGFYEKYNPLVQEAYTSAQTYKEVQKRDAEIQKKGKQNYRSGDYQGSIDAWEKWKNTFDPNNIGGADYTDFLPQEHSPLTDKVIKTIMPTVQKIGKENEANGRKKMGYEDSKGVLFQNIHNNAQDFDDALYEYKTTPPEKLKSIEEIYAMKFPDKAKPIENVSDYIEQVGMPYLPFESEKLQKWQVYGNNNSSMPQATRRPISETETEVFTPLASASTVGNQVIEGVRTITDNNTGKVIKAYGVSQTNQQKNEAKKAKYEADLEKYNKEKNDTESIIKQLNELIIDAIKNDKENIMYQGDEYSIDRAKSKVDGYYKNLSRNVKPPKPTMLPSEVELPIQQAIELQQGKLKTQVEDVASGKAKDKVIINEANVGQKNVPSQTEKKKLTW